MFVYVISAEYRVNPKKYMVRWLEEVVGTAWSFEQAEEWLKENGDIYSEEKRFTTFFVCAYKVGNMDDVFEWRRYTVDMTLVDQSERSEPEYITGPTRTYSNRATHPISVYDIPYKWNTPEKDGD